MRCRNNLPYITDTYRLTYLVSMIPGKFQPTGSYNHADKSEQLPKIEPLRLLSLHFKGSDIGNWLSITCLKTKTSRSSRWCRLKLALTERPISLNTSLKIQAICSDCSYFMRCRNKLPYATETNRLTCFVSVIPGKFQPIGSYNHADKSGQLPKTEPLRLRYSSL